MIKIYGCGRVSRSGKFSSESLFLSKQWQETFFHRKTLTFNNHAVLVCWIVITVVN